MARTAVPKKPTPTIADVCARKDESPESVGQSSRATEISAKKHWRFPKTVPYADGTIPGIRRLGNLPVPFRLPREGHRGWLNSERVRISSGSAPVAVRPTSFWFHQSKNTAPGSPHKN